MRRIVLITASIIPLILAQAPNREGRREDEPSNMALSSSLSTLSEVRKKSASLEASDLYAVS
jgi:hypothetical protein